MKVLLLSPHTDDVELGAGGTVAKLLEEGHELYWVVFSTCEDSLPENLPKDTLKKEFLEVLKRINFKGNYKIYNFKVRNFFKNRQEILEELVKLRKEFKPDLVITPSSNDFHQDHYVIAMESIRAFIKHSNIIGYEIPWNNIKIPLNFFVSLSKNHIEKKIEMLNCYKSQFNLRNYFSKDFIFGLAKVRGVQLNSEYAEAFEVIRWRL